VQPADGAGNSTWPLRAGIAGIAVLLRRPYFIAVGKSAVSSFFQSDGAEDGFAAEGSAKTVQGEGEADEEGKPGPG
jgi:hypothetical protein